MRTKQLSAELEALYRARYPQFLRVALAITGDTESARDAVQEGFARAIRSARSYRGDGTVEAWLWRVIVNAARAARPTPASDTAAGEPSANGGADANHEIRAWIATLPERQRLAVFLRYYADLDYKAIATALGIEVGTVSATLSSAHAALRKSVQEFSR